jgi:hypothetical protein
MVWSENNKHWFLNFKGEQNMSKEKAWKPPEFIWLQREDEEGNMAGNRWEGEIYWCDEQIYRSDVKYQRIGSGEVPEEE